MGVWRPTGVNAGVMKLKKILNNTQTNQKQPSLKKRQAETALGSQPRLVIIQVKPPELRNT